MSYYQGDFYAQGDPGLFSFLGKGVRAVAKFAHRLPMEHIPVIGPAAAKVTGVIGHIKTAAARVPGAAAVGRAITKHPVLSAAGAAGAAGALAGVEGGRMVAPGVAGPHGRAMAMPGLRRHRRMRVTNPKALRRAIRRATGFAKLAMRTIHLIHPKKKVKFGGFRRGRARARS